MSLLDPLLPGNRKIYDEGTLITPSTEGLNFTGAGVSVAYNGATGRTDVTIITGAAALADVLAIGNSTGGAAILVTGAGYIAIGDAPAAAGALRLNNATYALWKTFGAGTYSGLGLDASNIFHIGGGGGANADPTEVRHRAGASGTGLHSFYLAGERLAYLTNVSGQTEQGAFYFDGEAFTGASTISSARTANGTGRDIYYQGGNAGPGGNFGGGNARIRSGEPRGTGVEGDVFIEKRDGTVYAQSDRANSRFSIPIGTLHVGSSSTGAALTMRTSGIGTHTVVSLQGTQELRFGDPVATTDNTTYHAEVNHEWYVSNVLKSRLTTSLMSFEDAISLRLGATNPATAGTIRGRNAADTQHRNVGNTNNLPITGSTATDQVFVGATTLVSDVLLRAGTGTIQHSVGGTLIQTITSTAAQLAAGKKTDWASGTAALSIGGTDWLTSTATVSAFAQSVSITASGAAVAASGSLRLHRTGTGVMLRNVANTADVTGLGLDGSDQLVCGDSTNVTNAVVRASTQVVSQIAGTNTLIVAATQMTLTATTFAYNSTVTNPVFQQSVDSGADATGDTFTVGAQNVNGSGTTITGGALILRAGDSNSGTATNKIGGNLTARPGNGTTGGVLALQSGGAVNRLRINDTGLGFFTATPVAQPADQVAFTDNIAGTLSRTLAAIPDPADTPASADTLRDDIVTNVLPKIRDALSSLADGYNDVRANVLRPLGLTA